MLRGTLEPTDLDGVVWADPLASLPLPTNDLVQPRTYPGATQRGSVTWTDEAGVLHFEAQLPHRYGDIGYGPDGTFANGAWYPQPTVDGHLPVVHWTVRVDAEPAWSVAAGSHWGLGGVDWEGDADRVSLAAIRNAKATPVAPGVVLLSKRAPRRHLTDALMAHLATLPHSEGVIVEATLLRRLSRGGAGLAYVSDRAWRTSPPGRRFHHVATMRGVIEGLSPLPDPYARELAAAATIQQHADDLRRVSADDVTRWGRWLPLVDTIRYDRRTPFIGDLLEEVNPSDPLLDDLAEIWDPTAPGAAVIAEAALSLGAEQLDTLAACLRSGADPDGCGVAVDLPDDFFSVRQVPPVPQNLELRVDDVVTVTRQTSAEAPPLRVELQLGDTTEVLDLPAGPSVVERPVPDGPARIDPHRLVAQTSRLRDSWPPRTTVTASAYVSTINLTERWVSAVGTLNLRRTYDTHNRWSALVYTDRTTRVGTNLAYTRLFGPQVDGLQRVGRVRLSVDQGWLNPSFASSNAPIALGAAASVTLDDRISYVFPVRGGRLGATISAGTLAGSPSPWTRATASATRILSPHPRLALALNTTGGVATGDVPHRLLSLGGSGALRSVPASLVVGSRLGVGRAELRVQPMRARSVRLPFMWATDIDLTLGTEVGRLLTPDGWVTAAGLTAGHSITADWFGVSPGTAALTFGWPIYADGIAPASQPPFGLTTPYWPEIWLRWGQAF